MPELSSEAELPIPDAGSRVGTVLVRLIVENTRVAPGEIADDKRLREDLGLDSFDLVCLASAVEDEWNIRLADDEITGIATIEDLRAALSTRLSSSEVEPVAARPAAHRQG
jgi:acyl carrier protein